MNNKKSTIHHLFFFPSTHSSIFHPSITHPSITHLFIPHPSPISSSPIHLSPIHASLVCFYSSIHHLSSLIQLTKQSYCSHPSSPSLSYHHYFILLHFTFSSLIHHSSITHPSLIHHSSITHPSLIHHSSITHPSLIHHSSITHPSLIHHSSITHPSLIHHSSITVTTPSLTQLFRPFHQSQSHPFSSSIFSFLLQPSFTDSFIPTHPSISPTPNLSILPSLPIHPPPLHPCITHPTGTKEPHHGESSGGWGGWWADAWQ